MNRPRRIAPIVLINLLALGGLATSARAQGDNSSKALEGVWSMSITLRDCATTAPLGPPFRTLLTFHAGGTVSESPGATQFAPGQRSNGHGVWSHSGAGTFTSRFIAMVLYDTPPAPPAPGFLAGWQLVQSTFTVVDIDRLSVAATVEFFDLNRQRYRAACPTGTAERFR